MTSDFKYQKRRSRVIHEKKSCEIKDRRNYPPCQEGFVGFQKNFPRFRRITLALPSFCPLPLQLHQSGKAFARVLLHRPLDLEHGQGGQHPLGGDLGQVHQLVGGTDLVL